MLKLNLSHLTGDEIADMVAAYCAEFGDVNSVVVPKTSTLRTFALVNMATAASSPAGDRGALL